MKSKNINNGMRTLTSVLCSLYSVLCSLFSVLFVSCSQEEILPQETATTLQFVVSDFPMFGEGIQTRVIGTQDEGKTAWENGDQIIVTLISQKYGEQTAALTYDGSSWSTEASLSYLENEIPSVSVFYAPCYEVTEDGKMQLRSGMQLGMTEYLSGNYEIENGIMTITFEGAIRTYSRLRIASEAGQKLTVATTGFTPAGATSAVADDYTLTTDDNGNAFLYGVFAEGATVSVNVANIEIVSHAFASATEECVSYALDAPWPYLTFTASAAQTMTIKTYGGYVLDESMQYSVNGGEWAQLTAKTAITFGGDNGTLRLRGKSANGTTITSSICAQISFDDDNVQVACSGDIRTLVDYENYATVSTAKARFCYLFENCKSLTSAPELPATTLADKCYYGMFWNCTSLTVAPELPATTLANECYRSMFYNCTNLTIAPKLPATTLAESCYRSMFYNCTNLTTAPELPATTLAEYCYLQMFNGCTSLTAAPKLPATTLFANCYYEMFSGCTSLTAAPELPAATLVNWCYNRMFYGCTNLSSITMLATNIPANVGCLNDWVSGVASSGTFTKAASLIQGSETGQIPTGTSGIPEGWTVVNK